MRVFFVEDEETVVAALEHVLRRIFEARDSEPNVELVTFSNAADALNALSEPFDLALLDLQIPPSSSPSLASVDHGFEVLREFRKHHPGNKIIVFSGHGSGPVTRQLLDMVWSDDPVGRGESNEQPMIEFVEKERLDECAKRLVAYADDLTVLEAIDVDLGETPFRLTDEEKRVLRICARRQGCQRAKAKPLGGGLSTSRVLRVEVLRQAPQPVASLVAKLGPLEDLASEAARFREHVAPRLDAGSYAPQVDHVKAGAGARGGLFVKLATGHERSFFDVLSDSDEDATTVVQGLRKASERWLAPRIAEDVVVAEVRRLFVEDEPFSTVAPQLSGLPWEEVERVVVSINRCSQHGDLHPLNVLVTEALEPLLIDFARALEGPASIDPVTLEMSLVFHPAFAEIRQAWPTEQQAEEWRSLDSYVANCPWPNFVRACRTWGYEAAAGDREVAAVVYANAARQLQFAAPDLPRRYIGGAIREIVA